MQIARIGSPPNEAPPWPKNSNPPSAQNEALSHARAFAILICQTRNEGDKD